MPGKLFEQNNGVRLSRQQGRRGWLYERWGSGPWIQTRVLTSKTGEDFGTGDQMKRDLGSGIWKMNPAAIGAPEQETGGQEGGRDSRRQEGIFGSSSGISSSKICF